jgi:hypothetical protein
VFHRDSFSQISFSPTSWKFNEIFQVPQIYTTGADAFPKRKRRKSVREIARELPVALPAPALRVVERSVRTQDLDTAIALLQQLEESVREAAVFVVKEYLQQEEQRRQWVLRRRLMTAILLAS